jgi:hypothetical protein
MNDNNIEEVGKGIMSVFVRFVGLFLLLAGVYVALHVMLKAMELYEKPQSIERFAQAIERGSNIDKSLSSFRDAVISEPATESEVEELSTLSTQQTTRGTTESAEGQIRVSYFFAWIIMLMLLMLIGSISLRAIKTGGELVLYDIQIKQFAKMLVKESSKARDR